MMGTGHVWQPEFYDEQFKFNTHFGQDLVALLQAKPGEKILDLGCGTGDLTEQIAMAGARTIGMDLSAEMLKQAKNKYPQLSFMIGDARSFKLEQPVDAIFSHAALHWVQDAKSAVRSIWGNLQAGGRFVAEFGGKGNVETIAKAIDSVLSRYDVDAEQLNPWYFPSVGEYSSLLERQGFRVTYAVHFDRWTRLAGGDEGLRHWLHGFAADVFFQKFSEEEREQLHAEVEAITRDSLYKDGIWHADYKRLRVVAIK